MINKIYFNLILKIGPIALFLLEEGYVKYVDWSAQSSSAGADALLAAQKKAQNLKKNYWKANAKKVGDVDNFEFTVHNAVIVNKIFHSVSMYTIHSSVVYDLLNQNRV